MATRACAAFDRSGRWADDGARTPTAWLAGRCRVPEATARRRLMRLLESVPGVRLCGECAEADEALRRRTGTLVGRAVASVVNLLDLHLAVVAGSVALGYGSTFFAAAQDEIDARCRIEFARGARIVPAGLGDEGPLVGAAAVGWRAVGVDVGVG